MNWFKVIFLMSSLCFAQEAERERHLSRKSTKVLSIDQKKHSYWLSFNSGMEYRLNHSLNKKLQESKKISQQDSDKIKKKFSQLYFNLSYGMSSNGAKLKDCKNFAHLSLHGDKQQVCSENVDKMNMINQMIKVLQ